MADTFPERNIVVWRKYFVAGHGVSQAAMAEVWATLRANEIPADWPETRVMALEFVQGFSYANDIVIDCFAGSGTTLVACQNLQRKARAIELSPAYCAVILQRMRDAFPTIEIERING